MKNYHPLIEALETIAVDRTYSTGISNFFVVPSSLIIEYLHDNSLWKGCPSLVNYELSECIKEIKNKGEYPYNSTVGQLFCDKKDLGTYSENTFLSAMVYCTQQHNHAIEEEEQEKLFFEKMSADGFIKASEELLESIKDTDRRFLVVLNGTNFMGATVKTVSDNKMRLIGNNGAALWMKPRVRRSGYRAEVGQYIKEIN